MDNPAKLATQGTQDEKKRKQKQYNTIFVWSHYTQTNTNSINKTWNTAGLILLIYLLTLGGGYICRGYRGQMCYCSCMRRPWLLL